MRVNIAQKICNDGRKPEIGDHAALIYRFENCALDTDRYRLDVDGAPVSVEPLVFDLLVYLLEHRARVVSRDELLDNLWQGKVVTDAALAARLKDARRAIGDSGKQQRMIKTCHGRGYQFIAEVAEMPVAEAGSQAEGQVVAVSNLQEKPSVVVLPFVNMSGDPEQAYFSDGITEDVITELSRFDVLYVIARHSSFALKDKPVDHGEIAAKLGVQYIVEGSVRRVGNRVRVTAQLTDAETGKHVWAERYDRELEDIFAVQDELTRSIVAVLPGRVQEDVAERASRKQTDSLKAYEFMLRAKAVRDSFSADATAAARSLLEQAIALDPLYARPYMYLSDTYLVDFLLGIEKPDTVPRMMELARKAASLDSHDVAIMNHLGYTYLVEGRWDEAERQFERTMQKMDIEAEQMLWGGYGLMLIGKAERSRDITLEAKLLDPLHPSSYDWVLGQAQFFLHDFEAVTQTLMGEALLNSIAHGCLAGAYAHLGRLDEAGKTLDLFVEERHREFASRDLSVESDTLDTLAGGYRKQWQLESYWETFSDGLRKAGLPE
ncbi:MAG: winged helix-turn-helix domain-containing protein [Gammaproteobacteria bacterium]|nr:MAG: winged helix-turn-helix domain-containing protein [Gammaproteobacteria bacterium]